MNSLLILFLVTLSGCWAQTARYDNYKVFKMIPKTDEQLNLLRDMMKNGQGYDFWKEPSHKFNPVSLMVPPHKLADFYEIINNFNLEATKTIDNVQKLIDETTPNYNRKGGLDWNEYYTYDAIVAWLGSLETSYPDKVKVVLGGKSYEGRNITGVKISFNPDNKAVFIVGGIHAREWIAPATVTFLINQVLTSQDPKVREIVENYNWYLFPSINPDGYEYSHTHNRLWRKNRKPSQYCDGVDLERNWDYHWEAPEYCGDTYSGKSPFSETETKTLSEFIRNVDEDISVFLSFHSFSQLILLPYGYTTEHLDNYDELYEIALKAKNSLARRYGTKYRAGNIPELLYYAYGITIDWVKGVLKVPITYTFELRPTQGFGYDGFLLPKEQIIPTGEETFDAVLTIVEEAKLRGY